MKDVQEMLDCAAGHEFITIIDLLSGFHQIPMADHCKEMTAFSAPGPQGGQYHFKVMPFGLKNAPATFQQFVDDVFRPFIGLFMVVYIDDLAIYSNSKEEHLEHLEKIFVIMRKNQIFAKKKKCFFMQKHANYLGHRIGPEGISMDPKKVETITNWPDIKTIKQLQAFLGMTGYYRRFIANYGETAKVLTNLLKTESINEWTDEHQAAKERLIWIITNAPILRPPNFSKPFTITTDASDVALGGVLSQDDKPIAFTSKTFNNTEVNWTIYEKELFAIVYALRKWEHYVLSNIPVTIVTDNNAVTHIQKQDKITPKQARWLSYMAMFNYTIAHRPGAENKVADAISRKDIFGISIIDNQHWIEQLRQLTKKITLLPWMTIRNGLIYKNHHLYVPGYEDIRKNHHRGNPPRHGRRTSRLQEDFGESLEELLLGKNGPEYRKVHQVMRHVSENKELYTETLWPTQPNPSTSQQVRHTYHGFCNAFTSFRGRIQWLGSLH